jgi:hypothetical protein
VITAGAIVHPITQADAFVNPKQGGNAFLGTRHRIQPAF